MSRYASNQEVVSFFASHDIEVTHVRREGEVRHLKVQGHSLTLPMPASAEDCLSKVRKFISELAEPKPVVE